MCSHVLYVGMGVIENDGVFVVLSMLERRSLTVQWSDGMLRQLQVMFVPCGWW